MSYNIRPAQQELSDSRQDAMGWLTSELSIVLYWGKGNLVMFNASKIQFLHLSTRHNLLENYSLFFNYAQLSLFITLNTFGISFTEKLNWRFHISSPAKSASKKVSVL